MTESIDTKGGAVVGGNANTGGGDLVGRDQYNIESLNLLDRAHQDGLIDLLVKMFVGGESKLDVAADSQRLTVMAPDMKPVTLAEGAAEELLSVAARYTDPKVYLSALVVNPRYRRWGQQFVALAGTLTEPKRVVGFTEIPQEYVEHAVQGEGAQRVIQRVKLDNIEDALKRHSAFVLLGEPGSGKTTFLERLLLDAATQTLAKTEGQIPLLLPLADYRDYSSPEDFLSARWKRQVGTGDLNDYLQRGRLLLLCDALNEMPFNDQRDYRDRVGVWRRWVGDLPSGNRAVFTCRSLDYSESLALPQVEIARLDDGRIRDFLHRYLDPKDPGLATGAWERLEGSDLLDLVRNPWYVWMLALQLATNEGWPAGRAELFKEFVGARLNREQQRNHPDWPGKPAMQQALAVLAEAMQPLGEGTRLPKPEALAKLPGTVECEGASVDTPPEAILRLGLAATLLDTTEPGEGGPKIKFYHHQLQEYFAAQQLLNRLGKKEDLSRRWWQPRSQTDMPEPGPLRDEETLPAPPTTGWEEPTVLTAGLASDPVSFLETVRKVNPVLAARCLREPGLREVETTKRAVNDDLLGMMTDPKSHLRARLAAGEALGRLGDPRFEEVSVESKLVRLPPLVAIPAGSVRIGSGWWEVRFGGGFADERPRHERSLSAFHIGKYPVTNAEYACFIEDGGYGEPRWWQTERGRAWLRGELASEASEDLMERWRSFTSNPDRLQQVALTENQINFWQQALTMDEKAFHDLVVKFYSERAMDRPGYWEDERYHNPSQPVVGVTWFEASAYCCWLTERWRAVGEDCPEPLPNGAVLRLPTEAEWERAARYPKPHRYPWGRRWQEDHANSDEGHVRRPSPVGAYPTGRTGAGVEDLAGNVWEWTSSSYQAYPTRSGDNPEESETARRRVLRGGSWRVNLRLARCASRIRNRPDIYSAHGGFRVLLSLADSEF